MQKNDPSAGACVAYMAVPITLGAAVVGAIAGSIISIAISTLF